MGETEQRVSNLERDVDEIKKTINGEGMEDGMKTTVAKTDQKVDALKVSVEKINSSLNGLAMLLAAGIITMIFEAVRR